MPQNTQMQMPVTASHGKFLLLFSISVGFHRLLVASGFSSQENLIKVAKATLVNSSFEPGSFPYFQYSFIIIIFFLSVRAVVLCQKKKKIEEEVVKRVRQRSYLSHKSAFVLFSLTEHGQYIYIYLNIISVYVCLYSNTIINNNNNNTHFLLRITVYESFGLWVMAVDADHHVSILI